MADMDGRDSCLDSYRTDHVGDLGRRQPRDRDVDRWHLARRVDRVGIHTPQQEGKRLDARLRLAPDPLTPFADRPQTRSLVLADRPETRFF